MTEVCDAFYVDENKRTHRVSSLSYSQDGESVSTFCSGEFDISGEDEILRVPIRLLDKTEVCVGCERNHAYTNYERFNFDDNDFDYKFFLKFSLRLGENKGSVRSEIIEANSIEDAKSKIEKQYSAANVHRFMYISRAEEYGDWVVIVDETNYSPED